MAECLAGSVLEHKSLDLGVVCPCPTLGLECTQKRKKMAFLIIKNNICSLFKKIRYSKKILPFRLLPFDIFVNDFLNMLFLHYKN